MDLKTISLYVILFLVMIGLPVLLGKLTGSNPMEFLLGDRVKGTIFGKRKKEKEEASGSTVTNPKDVSKEKNSSRQELMKTISDLLSYGRRNRFYCIIPGTLACKDEVTSLAVLMVTRNSVLGFNCFGYGGTVYAGSGEDEWRQVINQEEKKIDSPAVKNMKQKELLDTILAGCGYPAVKTEIFGVFTASDVILKDSRKTRCYTKNAMMEVLKENRFLEDKGLDPKAVGKALDPYRKKA